MTLVRSAIWIMPWLMKCPGPGWNRTDLYGISIVRSSDCSGLYVVFISTQRRVVRVLDARKQMTYKMDRNHGQHGISSLVPKLEATSGHFHWFLTIEVNSLLLSNLFLQTFISRKDAWDSSKPLARIAEACITLSCILLPFVCAILPTLISELSLNNKAQKYQNARLESKGLLANIMLALVFFLCVSVWP